MIVKQNLRPLFFSRLVGCLSGKPLFGKTGQPSRKNSLPKGKAHELRTDLKIQANNYFYGYFSSIQILSIYYKLNVKALQRLVRFSAKRRKRPFVILLTSLWN